MSRRKAGAILDSEMVILQALAACPSHGFALAKTLERDGRAIFDALHRLEDWGLLSGRWDHSTYPSKRTYRLTAAGRRALATGAAPQAR